MPVQDAFTRHIHQFYDGILSQIKFLDDKTLSGFIEKLIDRTNELEEDGHFTPIEEDVRAALTRTLRNFLEESFTREDFDDEIDELLSCEQDPDDSDNPEESGMNAWEKDFMRGYNADPHSDQSDDSSDDGYYGIFWHPSNLASDSDSDQEYQDWKERKIAMLGDLDDLQNLLSICRPSEGLDWLVHQEAEYTYRADDALLEGIHFDEIDIDEDLAKLIVHKLFLDRHYKENEVCKDGFIHSAIVGAFERLRDDTLYSLIDERKSMKLELLENVEEKFAKTRETLADGELEDVRKAFNTAYNENDFISMQNIWPKFAWSQLFQKSFSKSTVFPLKNGEKRFMVEGQLNTRSYNKKAKSHAEKTHPRLKKYYRVYPSRNTRWLSYDPPALRYPHENHLRFDLLDAFGSLRQQGLAAKKLLIDDEKKKDKIKLKKHRNSMKALGAKGDSAKKAKLKKTIENAQKKLDKDNTTNVVTAKLVFVVTFPKTEAVDTPKRVFIPVPLRLSQYPKSILSRNPEDRVFKTAAQYKSKAAKSQKEGAGLLSRRRPKEEYQARTLDTSPQSLYHSERVLIEALNNQANVREVLSDLYNALQCHLNSDLPPDGLFEVNAASLLIHSTNSICNNCTVSLIGTQDPNVKGFLKKLTNELNAANPVYGDGKRHFFTARDIDIEPAPHKAPYPLGLTIFAASEKAYTEQARDLSDEQTKLYNPKGTLSFENDEIDLHKVGTQHRNRAAFFEFVQAPIPDPTATKYEGKFFISGDKKGDSLEQQMSQLRLS